jgi:hypothetical protein
MCCGGAEGEPAALVGLGRPQQPALHRPLHGQDPPLHADQIWHIGNANPNDNRYWHFINNAGQCLGVDSGFTTKGARIRAGRCVSTNADQYWGFLRNPACSLTTDPWEYLLNFKSQWIIGVQGGNMTNGTSLVRWSTDCHADQVWMVQSP